MTDTVTLGPPRQPTGASQGLIGLPRELTFAAALPEIRQKAPRELTLGARFVRNLTSI